MWERCRAMWTMCREGGHTCAIGSSIIGEDVDAALGVDDCCYDLLNITVVGHVELETADVWVLETIHGFHSARRSVHDAVALCVRIASGKPPVRPWSIRVGHYGLRCGVDG